MTSLYVLIALTVMAVGLLLAYGHRLFEENASRVRRSRRPLDPPAVAVAPRPEVEWRTLVGADR